MRYSPIRQGKHGVHLLGTQGNGRGIDPDVTITMLLHQCPRTARVGFQMQNPRGMGIQHLVGLHLLIGGQQHIGLLPGLGTRRLHHHRFRLWLGTAFGIGCAGRPLQVGVGDRIDPPKLIQTRGVDPLPTRQRLSAQDRRATNVLHLGNRLPAGKPGGDLGQRALGIAEHQQISFGIKQHRAADGFRPVVEVSDTPQRGLNATDDHRHVLIGLLAALGVHQHRTVWAAPPLVARRIGIVVT